MCWAPIRRRGSRVWRTGLASKPPVNASPDSEERSMSHGRGWGPSSRLAWVLAVALTLASSAPAMAVDKKPTPSPSPSPEPSPTPTSTPTPSPEPSPTPTQTQSPRPTSEPPLGSTPAPDPPPGVDSGSFGSVPSPEALASPQAEDIVGPEPGTGSARQNPDAAGSSGTSLIESVTSILDQLASADVPVGGPPCDASGCRSPLSTDRSKAIALVPICIILAVVGASRFRARRRRSLGGSSAQDA